MEKKKANRTRSHHVTLRMTNEEYDDFKKKVNASGISQQDYILDAIRDGRIMSDKELLELKAISGDFDIYIRQIRGMANNINQITHVLHANGNTPSKEELNRILTTLIRYREEGEKVWQSIRFQIARQPHMLQ